MYATCTLGGVFSSVQLHGLLLFRNGTGAGTCVCVYKSLSAHSRPPVEEHMGSYSLFYNCDSALTSNLYFLAVLGLCLLQISFSVVGSK